MISPEGCASILWKDSSRVAEASECLKMTADDLIALGAVERVIPEDGFSEGFYRKLKADVAETFRKLKKIPADTLVENRYRRFRKF